MNVTFLMLHSFTCFRVILWCICFYVNYLHISSSIGLVRKYCMIFGKFSMNQPLKMDSGYNIAFLKVQLGTEINADKLKMFPEPMSTVSHG